MYIENIKKFYPKYENISREKYIKILEWANIKEFDEFKLEKDFLLSLILIKFWELFPDLTFKWGTCLNKIYFPYFRLSEDLDFVISKNIGRTARKTLLRKYEQDFSRELWKLWLTTEEKRTKFDEHKLMMLNYTYNSVIDGSSQTIKLDISLKWTLQLAPISWEIQSIYKDKILEEDIFWTHTISCIDLQEALAEKIRAALTRKFPAIRDFFDVWYIKNNSDFDFSNPDFKKLVDIKLAEVDYEYSSKWDYGILEKQIKTDLQPVLHQNYNFSLREIYDFIMAFKT